MALFSRLQLTDTLGLTAGVEDVFLTRLQGRVLDTFEKLCDRSFAAHDGEETHVTRSDWLYPRHLPVETVSSVTVDGSAFDYEQDGDRLWIGRDYTRRFEARVDFAYRPRRVTVDYTGGYAPVL